MRIGVTGATGYLGREIARAAISRGHEVVALTRSPPKDGLGWIHIEFGHDLPLHDLVGLDAIVHAAAVVGGEDVIQESEVDFARQLFKACRDLSIRAIFVSSQTASADAVSAYGRTKARIEDLAEHYGHVSLRPGLIYGGAASGLFGMLDRFVRFAPVLPAFRPAPVVHPISVFDVAERVCEASEAGSRSSGVYYLIGEAISFDEFLLYLALRHRRNAPFFVPLPIPFVRVVLKLGSFIFGPSWGAHRLDSLVALSTPSATEIFKWCGRGKTRNHTDRLGALLERRWLVNEAYCMHKAVGLPTSVPTIRQYVRIIKNLGIKANRRWRCWHINALFIALNDAKVSRKEIGSLAWRQSVVLRVCEASQIHVTRFIKQGK